MVKRTRHERALSGNDRLAANSPGYVCVRRHACRYRRRLLIHQVACRAAPLNAKPAAYPVSRGHSQSARIDGRTCQTAVPNLTFVERIKLNARVSLRWQAKALACQHRIFPKSGPSAAKPSGVIFRLAASFSSASQSMPTLQETLRPYAPDRRAVGRRLINSDILMHFAGGDGVHGCRVRDITNLGAAIHLNGLNIILSVVGVSFDNFRTMRLCRLEWREGGCRRDVREVGWKPSACPSLV
jgi:hypothetical protein